MIEQLLEYDQALFLFLNNLGTPAWDNFWLVITYQFTFIPLYALLLFLLYKKLGLKSLLILVVVIALMITFTDQVTNIFKRGFERPRPCGEASLINQMRFIASHCGKYGFFSGHSSNSMAAAVFAGDCAEVAGTQAGTQTSLIQKRALRRAALIQRRWRN